MSMNGTHEWLPELGDDDLAVLVEALEAWERKDQAGEMMGDLMEEMVRGREPHSRAHVEARIAAEKRERERATQLRKERSLLLRAKLLTIRDRRRGDAFSRDALKGTGR
jgi:hypothetical protein